ncbi:MAG: MoxR family ATPase [Pseudomonadota bacterium]
MSTPLPSDVNGTLEMLGAHDYVADRSLATALFLSLRLGRPLFLEGDAGVGKTEIAKVVASATGSPLVRLQCYEGLDIAAAAYEWNYPAQMMEIRLAEAGQGETSGLRERLYSEAFLTRRPLLQALQPQGAERAVLLIDELDRADEPFEAFLLEVLSDFQMSIPEMGTVHADNPPIVIVTSNRTREIHDAIKRRCFYHWVDYPSVERERDILRRKVPNLPDDLSKEIVAFVQSLRGLDLFKSPGVAETLDWAHALTQLDVVSLDPEVVDQSVGALLKYQDDIARLRGTEAASLLEQIRMEMSREGQ